MPQTHVKEGLITMSHGELFATVQHPIPGQLNLRGYSPWVVVPVPAGFDAEFTGGMTARELRAYLDHGMVFDGLLSLREDGHGLKLVGGENLRPVVDPHSMQRKLIDGIIEAAENLSDYRAARLRSGVAVTIADWQGEEREDKTTPDTIRLKIQSEDERLLLTTSDGRKLDLELQDGVLRTMAYENEDGKEAPVITSLPPHGDIRTDREDYDREIRQAPDDFAP